MITHLHCFHLSERAEKKRLKNLAEDIQHAASRVQDDELVQM